MHLQCFGPLALYHVEGKETVEAGATSIINTMEAELVLWLYMCACKPPVRSGEDAIAQNTTCPSCSARLTIFECELMDAGMDKAG